MVFDQKGFLWVGTADGLNRYDGYSFFQYRKSGDNKYHIHNTAFSSLAVDPAGKIWIGGNEGFEVLDPLNNKSTLLLSIPVPLKYSSWHFDSSSGNMLLFIREKGAWSFDIKTLKSTQLVSPADNREFCDYLSQLSFVELNGDLLLFSRGAGYAFRYHLKSHSAEKINLFAGAGDLILSEVGSFRENTLVFEAKLSGQATLVELNKTTLQVIHQKAVAPVNEDPFNKSCIYVKSINKIVVTDFVRGLIFFDSDFNETNNYPNTAVLSGTTKVTGYLCAIEKNNCLWMSSDPNGIIYCNLNPPRFAHFKNMSGNATNIAKGIFTDAEENVYNCLLMEGVQVFDKNGNYKNDLKNIGGNNNEPLRLYAFSTIIPASKDSVFIHCGNFLGFYNTRTGVASNYQSMFLKAIGIVQYEDGFNCTARITGNEFINCYHNRFWKISFYPGRIELSGADAVKENISSMYAVNSTLLLIGTDSGLYVSDNGKKTWYRDIGFTLIKNINKDRNGDFWICTPNGLWKLDGQLKIIRRYSTADGLANNFTYGTLTDNKMVWVSTNNGLSAYDPLNDKFSNYTIADGLQSNEFNSGAFWKSSNGKLYFGGINGITQINENQPADTGKQIPVIISRIKINDLDFLPDSASWSIRDISLRFRENNLTLEFAGLAQEVSQLTEYRYRLTGIDNDWVYAGKTRSVRYGGLTPGVYTFKVAASLNGRVWSTEEATIKITIQPPFWQTGWFRLLLILVSVVILWFFIQQLNKRKYRRQLETLKMQQQLEEERQRISRDLHDNMGAYTSAMLSNVQLLKSETGNNDTLNKMQSNAEQILSSLRETIWVLNNKSVNVQDLSGGFKNHCFNLLRNFENINFNTEENIVSNKTIPAATAIHLNHILQEALQNIIKHAAATNISFCVSSTDRLLMSLSDDGKGFDAAKIVNGNGLENMEWRAAKAGFKISTTSVTGNGTLISLEEII